MKTLWLRSESSLLEKRTPITPEDTKILIENGINVVVEKSAQRVFDDIEYQAAGARLVEPESWYHADPSKTVILGLKRFQPIPLEIPHTHIMFAHAYKAQPNSKRLRKAFQKGGGLLYDIEQLVENNQRTASFSEYAGYCAAATAILLKFGKEPLESYRTQEELINNIEQLKLKNPLPAVLILGDGRSGQGIVRFFKELNIPFVSISNEEIKRGIQPALILSSDIIINAFISRDTRYFPLLSSDLLARSQCSMIVDLICEPFSRNNPVPIYEKVSNFASPIIPIDLQGKSLSVVAIENYASLLPRESSIHFSAQLLPSLINLFSGDVLFNEWQHAYDKYLEFITTEDISYE